MEQLRSLTLLSQRPDYTVAQIMRRFYTHSSTMPGRVYYVGDPESMTMQVYNDVGITFIPESVVHFWEKSDFPMAPGTRMIPMSNKICHRRLFLTYPQTGLFTEETSHYMNYLRHYAALTQRLRSFPIRSELLNYLSAFWPEFSGMKPPTPGAQ